MASCECQRDENSLVAVPGANMGVLLLRTPTADECAENKRNGMRELVESNNGMWIIAYSTATPTNGLCQ